MEQLKTMCATVGPNNQPLNSPYMFDINDVLQLGANQVAQVKSVLAALNDQDRTRILELTAAIKKREADIARLTDETIFVPPPPQINGHHAVGDHEENEAPEGPTKLVVNIRRRRTEPGAKKKGRKKKTEPTAVEIPAKYDKEASKHIKSLFVLRKFGTIMTRWQINDEIVKLEKLGKGTEIANLDAILSQNCGNEPGKTMTAHKKYEGRQTGYELKEELR